MLFKNLALTLMALFSVALSHGVSAQTLANNEQLALDFVKDTVEKGLTFLSKPDSTIDEKKLEFKKLLGASFDMDTIARFALGRYWNVATPTQKKEYTILFKKMVVNVYTQRFGDYKGQKFAVKSARPVGNGDVLVMSIIQPVGGGEDVQVDWRVRNTSGTLKIVDVLVAGVSMSVTQRSDFSSVIQRDGGKIDGLIAYLRQKS